MIIVHQAIYGDRSGSYALLKTSLTDTEFAKRICNVTDLLDRPSAGYLTQSVIRGFAFNNSYIFIKSFPDNDSQVRRGRVLSHTLIIDQNDLHTLNNLDDLFSLFLSDIDKDPELKPIELDENSVPAQIINSLSREAAGINGLLNHSEYKNTLVWIGEDGYLSFIAQVWNQIEGNLRAKLKIGVGFNPQKVDTQNISILYVLEEYENKWKTSGFYIVGKGTIGRLESMSSFFLAGHEDESKLLTDLIKTFGIALSEIEDYSYLEKAVDTYKKLSPATNFNRLIILCDLISIYSPDQNIAKVQKSKLLTQVISRIELLSAKQIGKLKNSEWKGFLNAQQLIGDQIANWVMKSLSNLKVDKSITDVIAEAFDSENKVEWWKKAFLHGFKTTLEKWESTYAIVLWNWFIEDYNLVKTLENLIPAITQVETDFVNYWQRPEYELAQNIQLFAKERKWLTLHGMSILQMYSPEESIKIQLKIDTNTEYYAALNKMSECINDNEFIQLTLKIGETRLVKIAGVKAAANASLLDQLDVKNIIWRQIWLKAIEQGNKTWDGIIKPIDILFALFEQILNGEAVEYDLLLLLSDSDYNDLSAFNRRAEVWQYLTGSAKSGFLNASALGCVKLIDKKYISIDDLEKEIQNQLIEPVIIKQVIEDNMINVSTKIQLFEELSGIRENELLILLSDVHFSSEESKRLGKLILRKRWKTATNDIVKKINTREDLKLALRECDSILSVFERISLFISGNRSKLISREEWWSVFTEQCYTKYPKGPTDMGLWGRVDGENHDLLTIGTGREIWMDAIIKVRNGRVDIEELLQEMIEDFPYNIELKQLKKTYR